MEEKLTSVSAVSIVLFLLKFLTMVNAIVEPGHFEEFRAGSRTALGYYFGLDGEKVFQYLERKTEDAEIAKELTARVFTVSYETRERFQAEAQLRPCFFHTARRLAQAYLWEKGRIRKVEIDVLFRVDECSAFDDAEAKRAEVLMGLRHSFRKLTPRKRRILVYYYFRKMSTWEIAQRLRVVPQTVLNHKSQALNFIKLDLWGKWGENNPFLA